MLEDTVKLFPLDLNPQEHVTVSQCMEWVLGEVTGYMAWHGRALIDCLHELLKFGVLSHLGLLSFNQ